MYIVRIRCISKNTGEVFYEYSSNKFFKLDKVLTLIDLARSELFNRLMSDLKEDCTLEITVIQSPKELSLDFSPVDDVEDFNETPVVF